MANRSDTEYADSIAREARQLAAAVSAIRAAHGEGVAERQVADLIAEALLDRDRRAARIAREHASVSVRRYTRGRLAGAVPVVAKPLALQGIRIARSIMGQGQR